MTFATVMFADCITVWAAAAAVLADVLVLSVVAAAVLGTVTVRNAVVELPAAAVSAASVAVAACFAVEPVRGSAADSARATWRSESAKLDVTLTARNQAVGIYVSRCKMSKGSQGNSGREVSWNGSICTVPRLDDEPTAALA